MFAYLFQCYMRIQILLILNAVKEIKNNKHCFTEQMILLPILSIRRIKSIVSVLCISEHIQDDRLLIGLIFIQLPISFKCKKPQIFFIKEKTKIFRFLSLFFTYLVKFLKNTHIAPHSHSLGICTLFTIYVF